MVLHIIKVVVSVGIVVVDVDGGVVVVSTFLSPLLLMSQQQLGVDVGVV